MHVKLGIEEVTYGMFVAELDIPWLESPFLFQGFLIEHRDELDLLRAHCRYVLVDDALSIPDAAVQKLIGDAAIRRANAGDAHRQAGLGADEISALRARVRRSFTRHNAQASRTIRVMGDLRLGKLLDAGAAKEVVQDVVDSVMRDASAAWLMSCVRERNARLADHSHNATIIATAFARQLGYERHGCEVVGFGALLHDIGMAKVPLTIYDQPDELSAKQRELVRMHPKVGARMLAQSRGNLPEASVEIVAMHHEREDGNGYPLRKHGGEIPEQTQIVAISEVYDSLVSETPFASARSPHEALAVIHSRSGIDYKPSLVAEFIKCIGIYPIGSLVELVNGAIAVVVASAPERRLTPTLVLVRDAQGRDVLPRRTIDLSLVDEPSLKAGWALSRIIDPHASGLNTPAMVRAALM